MPEKRDEYTFSEAEMLQIVESNYQRGQADALDQLSKTLKRRFGGLFMQRLDDEARYLRQLLQRISIIAAEYRQKQRECSIGAFRFSVSSD